MEANFSSKSPTNRAFDIMYSRTSYILTIKLILGFNWALARPDKASE